MVLLHQGSIFSVGAPSEVITEENIRFVYETKVLVEKHPLSGAPRITPLGKGRENTGGQGPCT
jgi:iron complex transport system ATP-binding protein